MTNLLTILVSYPPGTEEKYKSSNLGFVGVLFGPGLEKIQSSNHLKDQIKLWRGGQSAGGGGGGVSLR